MRTPGNNATEASTTFWSWLFPITYLLHIAEEYWGGYSAYLLKLTGVYLSPTRFLVMQGIGVVLIITGIVLAQRLRFLKMMLVILGTVVLVNALSHITAGLTRLSYNPGLITSILIWLPLGIATLLRFKSDMSKARYWTGVAIGVGINVVVRVLTMTGGSTS